MLSIHTKIHESGRILIPAHFRRALDIKADDELVLQIRDNEITLTPIKISIKKAQDLVEKYNRDKVSLTDRLTALRQEER